MKKIFELFVLIVYTAVVVYLAIRLAPGTNPPPGGGYTQEPPDIIEIPGHIALPGSGSANIPGGNNEGQSQGTIRLVLVPDLSGGYKIDYDASYYPDWMSFDDPINTWTRKWYDRFRFDFGAGAFYDGEEFDADFLLVCRYALISVIGVEISPAGILEIRNLDGDVGVNLNYMFRNLFDVNYSYGALQGKHYFYISRRL